MKPTMIIGIAGESGVGKTTLAEIIALYYGLDKTLILSTDDLHKYSRHDPAWNDITHLNPAANNLELGDDHLAALAKGKPIWRSIYNHGTGHFDPPVKIEPKPVIIIEGLHALYTKTSQQLIGLKIYVDTDDELRTHWKIIRDTEQRGYKYNDVLACIEKRKIDAHLIRPYQKDGAVCIDVYVKPGENIPVIGDKAHEVELRISFNLIPAEHKELFSFIEKYMLKFNIFLNACEKVGNDIELSQAAGGNISIKVDGYMIIKASGVPLKEVTRISGYSVIGHTKIPEDIADDDELNFHITNSAKISDKYPRPSMETGFHSLLKEMVMHTHPIYLTLLLCLEKSKVIMQSLFRGYNYEYVEYVNPGYSLFNKIDKTRFFGISEARMLFLLENHGLIISADICTPYDFLYVPINRVNQMNEKAKEYIKNNLNTYLGFDLTWAENETSKTCYAFPDAVLFAETNREVRAMHNYINFVGNMLGGVRHLSTEHIHYLQNMDAEKYRKSL